ncbi:endonuclease NucS [Schaalia sp. 19OD2882]|uniref:endonuclease NucS n=1 Tax=Schaalia sp. 19OD2882 TaxID=2794089 RepID=UPI001C1ED77D|nr:endonuclease NucS [Schaalia sp. 19OD2882]QWW20365.1 endonuclease NucS [Schaalia sp. 19OD2882]
MRLIIARCTVDYSGRLAAHLDLATRVVMVKGDGSVLVHSDGGSYKPLNWMTAPCTLSVDSPGEDDRADGVSQVWTVQATKTDDRLVIRVHEVLHDVFEDLGVDPGLVKDGVETHLQELLAEQVPQVLGQGWELVRREHPTPVGPVDLMVRDPQGASVAIEVKRRGGIDGVEQLTRYLSLLGRDPLLRGLRGIFAAQEITKQARTLAEDRGIECLVLDYDAMRGMDDPDSRLF